MGHHDALRAQFGVVKLRELVENFPVHRPGKFDLHPDSEDAVFFLAPGIGGIRALGEDEEIPHADLRILEERIDALRRGSEEKSSGRVVEIDFQLDLHDMAFFVFVFNLQKGGSRSQP